MLGVEVAVPVGVRVGVLVGVRVSVLVGVMVGVSVGRPVAVSVAVHVAVNVPVGLLVGLPVGVLVGVPVGVLEGVAVGVLVGVVPSPVSVRYSHFELRAPPLSTTRARTRYVPAEAYTCVGDCTVECPRSPKSQSKDAIVPSVSLAAISKLTISPSGEALMVVRLGGTFSCRPVPAAMEFMVFQMVSAASM